MPVGPDRTEARRKARQLINNIAQEHTLNGAIFGTQLELLVNNCLETYVTAAPQATVVSWLILPLQLVETALRKEYTLPA